MDQQEITALLHGQRKKLERAIDELTSIRDGLSEAKQAAVDRTLNNLRGCLAEDNEHLSRLT